MENVIAWIDNIVAPKYVWILELEQFSPGFGFLNLAK